MISPIIPFCTIIWVLPSQKSTKMIDEKIDEINRIVFNHSGWKKTLIPLMMNKNTAMVKSIPARGRNMESFKKDEKSQDWPVQPMSGWNLTHSKLRTTYQKWTSPCKMRKMPASVLIKGASGKWYIEQRISFQNRTTFIKGTLNFCAVQIGSLKHTQ